MTRRRTRSLPAALAAAAVTVGLLASCSTDSDGEARAESAMQAERPAESVELGVRASTAATPSATSTTTVPPSTVAPTTAAPTTIATTSSTTLPPTTTTVAPIAALPVNVVPAPWPGEPIAAVGSRSGDGTAVVQTRLLQLGFWLSGVDGEYGLTTKQAVMAFQKYAGLEATGSVDDATAQALTAAPERARGASNSGTLVEIDKQKQLLFIVVGGTTEWVFNTSTGDGEEYEEPDQNSPGEVIRGVSLTPAGLFKTNRERPEGWWEGDLGEIYRPKYFRGGIAVHGSNSVPNYPASHGCVRVTVPAMDFIWDSGLVPLGTTVWVHDGMV